MDVNHYYRKGKWIEYSPRIVVLEDARWSHEQRKIAGAVYATAISRGHSVEKAHTLAEAYVFQQIYGGLKYSKELEEELKMIMDL